MGVIANLFDRQLGNELMMAFRPMLRQNRHTSTKPHDTLPFVALDSGGKALWRVGVRMRWAGSKIGEKGDP